LQTSLTATGTGTHMPYGITQCHLLPSRGDILPLSQPIIKARTQLGDYAGMQG